VFAPGLETGSPLCRAVVNDERIHRLWQAEGLRLPNRNRKKLLLGIGTSVGAFCPNRPNVV
jgi:hypothetical protein